MMDLASLAPMNGRTAGARASLVYTYVFAFIFATGACQPFKAKMIFGQQKSDAMQAMAKGGMEVYTSEMPPLAWHISLLCFQTCAIAAHVELRNMMRKIDVLRDTV